MKKSELRKLIKEIIEVNTFELETTPKGFPFVRNYLHNKNIHFQSANTMDGLNTILMIWGNDSLKERILNDLEGDGVEIFEAKTGRNNKAFEV